VVSTDISRRVAVGTFGEADEPSCARLPAAPCSLRVLVAVCVPGMLGRRRLGQVDGPSVPGVGCCGVGGPVPLRRPCGLVSVAFGPYVGEFCGLVEFGLATTPSIKVFVNTVVGGLLISDREFAYEFFCG